MANINLVFTECMYSKIVPCHRSPNVLNYINTGSLQGDSPPNYSLEGPPVVYELPWDKDLVSACP